MPQEFSGYVPRHFRFALADRVATITLDRPEKKNPLTFDSYAELRDLFREWLEVNFPDKLKHTMSLVQSMHGGKDYNADFGRRQRGSGARRARSPPMRTVPVAAVRKDAVRL